MPRSAASLRNAAFSIVISGFFALGLMFGAWQVMLPDLQQALHLSEGKLGLALTFSVLGSFPAMFLTGRLADRRGARVLMVWSCVLSGIVFSLLAWVEHYGFFIAVVFVMFGAAGALDVAINAAAVNYEQNTKDKKMSFFHAGYSGIASLSAMATGYCLYQGVPFRAIYPVIGVVFLLLAVWLWRSKQFDSVINQTPKALTDDTEQALPRKRFALLQQPIILLLALTVVLAFYSEGSLELWSAVYLRSSLDLPTLVGAAGPAIFHLAMAIGRLSSGWVLSYFHRTTVLSVSGVMAALGMLLSVSTLYPPLILFGFLLAGLALAAIVPIVFSLAGDTAPRQAGEVISVITILGYGGFMLGPAFMGNLAEVVGLRWALASLVLAGIGIMLIAFWLHTHLDKHKAT